MSNQKQLVTHAEFDLLKHKYRGTAERMVLQDDIERVNQWFVITNTNPFMVDESEHLTEHDFINPNPILETKIQEKLNQLLAMYTLNTEK